MADFDPSKFLRHLRAKTPTKTAPDPPPRPHDDTDSRISALELTVQQLQQQLKAAQSREQSLADDNQQLKELVSATQVSQTEAARTQLEASFQAQIAALETQLAQTQEVNSELVKQLETPAAKETKSEAKLKVEVRRPAFSPAVSAHSARYAKAPQGKLDLSALVELYKVMPDFPRPVLHIDFSDKMSEY